MEKFITKRIKESLKLKNRHYVKHSMDKSMDAPLIDDSSFNLHSVNSFIDSGYARAENRIMEEQFEGQLTPNEYDVFVSLRNGLAILEIAQKLEVSEEKVEFFCKICRNEAKAIFLAKLLNARLCGYSTKIFQFRAFHTYRGSYIETFYLEVA